MDAPIPQIDYELDPSWNWPAWKFDMSRDDMFGVLHQRYNTYPAPLQEWRAFYLDVSALATVAKDRDEFERLLGERRNKRRDELVAGFKDISYRLLGLPRLLPGTWAHATDYLAKKSFDSLLNLFTLLAGSDAAAELEHGPKTPESVHDDPIEPKHSETPGLTPSPRKSRSKPSTKRDIRRSPRSRVEKPKPRDMTAPTKVVKRDTRRYNLRSRQPNT